MLFGPFECGPEKTRGESLIRRSLGAQTPGTGRMARSQNRDEGHSQTAETTKPWKQPLEMFCARGFALDTTDCDVERRGKGKELGLDSQQREKRGIIGGGGGPNVRKNNLAAGMRPWLGAAGAPAQNRQGFDGEIGLGPGLRQPEDSRTGLAGWRGGETSDVDDEMMRDGDWRLQVVEMSPRGSQRAALCANGAGLTRRGHGGVASPADSLRAVASALDLRWALRWDGSLSRAVAGNLALWPRVQASGKKTTKFARSPQGAVSGAP